MVTPNVTERATTTRVAAQTRCEADTLARIEAEQINRATWHTVTPKRYRGEWEDEEWDVVSTLRAYHDYPSDSIMECLSERGTD